MTALLLQVVVLLKCLRSFRIKSVLFQNGVSQVVPKSAMRVMEMVNKVINQSVRSGYNSKIHTTNSVKCHGSNVAR